MAYSITFPDYQHDLYQHMYQLQQETSLCDVEVECHDGVIPVHKLVLLSCGSPYLQEQLTTDTLISPTGTMSCISLNDYPMSAVSKLVQGLYTGELIIDEVHAVPLFKACKFLGLDTFKTSVFDIIIKEFAHLVEKLVDKESALTEDLQTSSIDHSYISNPESEKSTDFVDENRPTSANEASKNDLSNECTQTRKKLFTNQEKVTGKRKHEPDLVASKKLKECEAEVEESQFTSDKTAEKRNSGSAENQNTNDKKTCIECKKTEDEIGELDSKCICGQCQEKADVQDKTKTPDKKILEVKKGNKNYSEDDIKAALEAVYSKELSIWAASKKYKIPDRTLRDRVKKNKKGELGHGKPAVFDMAQSQKLADCYKILLKSGYVYTVEDFCDIASHYAISLNKRARGNPLTKHWYYMLADMFPEIRELRNSAERNTRTQSHESSREYFFSHLRSSLDKYSLKDKPGLIYSFTPVEMSYRPPYIIKETVVWDDSKHQDTITLFACGNAEGEIIPPFFLFPESIKLPMDIKSKYSHISDDNLYSSEVFLMYLQSHFSKCSPADQHKILLVDAHNLYLSVNVFDWAEQNNITLVVIPAESRRELQPIACGCLSQFEATFETDFKKKCSASSSEVDKASLFSSVDLAFEKAFTKKRLQASFESCGISDLLEEAADDTDQNVE